MTSIAIIYKALPCLATDRLFLMLWRLFAALRCLRLKEQHVFLRAVVMVLMGPLGAATVRCSPQLIRRIIVVACIRHLTVSELQATALGPALQQTVLAS